MVGGPAAQRGGVRGRPARFLDPTATAGRYRRNSWLAAGAAKRARHRRWLLWKPATDCQPPWKLCAAPQQTHAHCKGLRRGTPTQEALPRGTHHTTRPPHPPASASANLTCSVWPSTEVPSRVPMAACASPGLPYRTKPYLQWVRARRRGGRHQSSTPPAAPFPWPPLEPPPRPAARGHSPQAVFGHRVANQAQAGQNPELSEDRRDLVLAPLQRQTPANHQRHRPYCKVGDSGAGRAQGEEAAKPVRTAGAMPPVTGWRRALAVQHYLTNTLGWAPEPRPPPRAAAVRPALDEVSSGEELPDRPPSSDAIPVPSISAFTPPGKRFAPPGGWAEPSRVGTLGPCARRSWGR